MASTGKCQYCGSTVTSDDRACPSCGAPNPNFIADTPRRVTEPKTIEELKEYCAERGMPLLRMRFFIGEDYKEPRAFGIFRDGNEFVVYKNKSDGSRAIRYRGPDEAYAVRELYLKLLSECHNRGIYPDGKPEEVERSTEKGSKKDRIKELLSAIPILIMPLLLVLAVVFFIVSSLKSCKLHRGDGYYDFNDGYYWYQYGGSWYYTDDDSSDWYDGGTPPVTEDFEDYYQGKDYDSDWGITNFKDSDLYDDYYGSDSDSGSDYDDWDIGDTDWGSDW